jgi:large subunit ribosomal protein L9
VALSVRLEARSGETGRLFGAVTTADVVEAITAAGGPSVDKRKVTIPAPIKTVGPHKVEVRVHPEVVAAVTVDVTSA